MKKGPEHTKNDNTNSSVGVNSHRKIRPSQHAERKKQEGKLEKSVIILG